MNRQRLGIQNGETTLGWHDRSCDAPSGSSLDRDGNVSKTCARPAGSVRHIVRHLREVGVARLDSSGSLDTGFGVGGKAIVPFDLGGISGDLVWDLALQADGKIVVGGHVDGPNGDRDFGLARLHANGALDPTFGSGGKTTVAFDLVTGGSDSLNGLAVPTSGGIYVAGSVSVADFGEDIGVAKVIGSVVFGDGFESGSVAAWSMSVP